MPHDVRSARFWEVVKGILLLLLCNAIAAFIVFIPISFALFYIVTGNMQSGDGEGVLLAIIWVCAVASFWAWQLLYVIPLIIWLKRRGNIGMMQGVIGSAVITALWSGAYCLTLV